MMSGGARQEGDTVGDYRLVRLSSEGQLTQTWEAEQISMQRSVMLEMLKTPASRDGDVVASFLADVKAKALVSQSGIGAVYEAVSNDEAVFFARERIDGESLETLHEAGKKFSSLEVVQLLGQIAGSMIYLDSEGVATVEYGLHHFVVGSNQQVRLMNLAVDGKRDERVDTRAKQLLGEVFDEMLVAGKPGATRVGSLCGFMADQDRPVPLTWRQIADLSQQVREQLEGSAPIPPAPVPEQSYVARPPMKIPSAFWALLGGFGLIAALIALVVLSGGEKKTVPTERIDAPKPFVEIPAGEYPMGDDKMVTIRESFSLNRTEVTFAQYNAFLEFPDHRKFQHPEQPLSKKDHVPDDWKTAWPAAVKGEVWQGHEMSTDCPVVGVDWWDAYAYAKWSQSRLPSLAEWAVAANFQGPPASPKGWGDADAVDEDQTGAGLIGMAGGVREWTRDPEVDPASQLSPKKPVAAGGSFMKGSGGIDSRVWLEDRGTRRSDLGFRVVPMK
jgi:formylglycine-generating enzyme required for sulfatase activity